MVDEGARSSRAMNPGTFHGMALPNHPTPPFPAGPARPGRIDFSLRLSGRLRAAGWILLTLGLVALPCAAQEDDMPRPGDSAYMERATSLLQQAVEAGDTLGTARAQLALAEHMHSRGLWAEAAAHAELGRNAARLAEDETLLPQLEHFMARALLRMERSAEATDLYLSLLDRAERAGDDGLAARANLSLSSLQGRAGDLQSARTFAESALQLTNALDDSDLRARVLINLARIGYLQERPQAARDRIAEAHAIAPEGLTDETRSSLLMAELSLAAFDDDDEAALAIARRAVAVAENVDSVFFRAFALAKLGPLLCRAGQPARAVARFEEAVALFEQSDAPFEQSETLGALAQCLDDDQRHAEAYDRIVQSQARLREAHSRQRSESMQASLAAFQSERQLREMARLVEEEQQLQTRVSRQQLRISIMVIGILLLGTLVAVLWMRGRRITEQRAAQQKLEQTRIDLLARTSHEIRNPAQGLIGLLERGASTDRRRAEDPDHQSALAAARMIQHLANDYLDLSLLEQGRLRICNQAHCNLTELVEHVRQLAESFLGEAMPRLNVSIASDLPEWIHADSDRLMQILLNLVVNAARYGGDHDIDLTLDQADEGDSLVIRVEDRGPGLGNAGEQLFDPYVRGDMGSENSRGSGLGLSISARIVEAMGGRMQACNRDKGGARFEIRLPLHAAEASTEGRAAVQTASDGPPPTCGSVLVVDDDRFARTGIRAVLDSFGCETFEAADWSTMQSVVEEYDPELVLLDRHLFGEDGLELARRLREQDRQQSRQQGRRQRRIVMVSGTERPAEVGDELIDDWITKPVTRARMAPLLNATPPG